MLTKKFRSYSKILVRKEGRKRKKRRIITDLIMEAYF